MAGNYKIVYGYGILFDFFFFFINLEGRFKSKFTFIGDQIVVPLNNKTLNMCLIKNQVVPLNYKIL